MKRLLNSALALIIISTIFLTGCFNSGGSTSGGNSDKKTLGVKFIVGANLGDKSFNESLDIGLKKAEKDFDIKYSVTENSSRTENYEPSILEAADDKNVDFVISTGMEMLEIIERNAAAYPDKKFIVMDTDSNYKVKNENVLAISFKQNEVEFLAGAIAAMKSETGVISFIGGQQVNVINDFLVGYIEGAKYVNQNIKVATGFTGSWTDATKASEIANAHINSKADIIHPAAGAAGIGALDKAAEINVFSIGVDSDQYALFKDQKPKTVDKLITSSLKELGNVAYEIFSTIEEGTQKYGETMIVGLKENAVGLVKNDNFNKYLTSEDKDKLDEILEKVDKGEIKVKTYYGMSNEEFNSLVNSVRP
ncbi:MAG: BMP family lipoprotein [Oscillospiraceae bacterium]